MAFARTPIFKAKVLSGASAADETGIYNVPAEIVAQADEWTMAVEYDHTSAAGAVVLESAASYTYAGTWATEATASWAAIDTVVVKHLTAANFALRVRVSSGVTDGACNVYLIGLPRS